MKFTKIITVTVSCIIVFKLTLPAQDIHQASQKGDLEQIKLLLKKNPELLNLKDKKGRTPLICAILTFPYGYTVNQGNRDVVKYLIKKGADLPEGDTATNILHPAAYCGFKELVAALVARGENIHTQNKNGGTLLHSAAAGGLENLVKQLIKKGLKLNQKNRYGLAPIHLAAISGFPEIIDILIQAGADINIKSSEGKTPLHNAREHGHQKAASLLITRGANQNPPQFPVLKGKYMGQKVPGKKPELFAPGIVSTIFVDHSSLSFSPDGKQVTWSPVIKNNGTIYFSRLEEDHWTPPQKAPFSGNFVDCMPVFAQNNQLIYCSDRPMNPGEKRKDGLWISEKKGHTWAKTHPLASNIDLGQVNSQPAISSNKNLYFSTLLKGGKGALDIYCSKYIKGQYTKPKNLGEPINTKSMDYSPLIAPDESYIIFSSDRPGGYGSLDLYISFRQKDGSWCNPMNLGDQINTKYYEWFNTFSADGKYFFFGSSRNGNFDIYWVDAGIIQKLKKESDYFNQWETFPVLKGKYLGQKPPGDIPQKFAPGIISTECMVHGSPAFSPDGKEVFWSILIENPTRAKMLVMQLEKGQWTRPSLAPFSKGDYVDVNPAFSPDGNRLFFRSHRQSPKYKLKGKMNIWFVERSDSGWTNPKPVENINTGGETSGSISTNGTIYFSRMEGKNCNIYKSQCIDGKYKKPQKLSGKINSNHIDIDPYISPDEKYVIFSSNRPGGAGGFDLYICFKNKDDKWDKLHMLGSKINTEKWELMPMLSPDGKYLFFISDRQGTWDVHWVDAGVIDNLSNK